MTLQEFTTKYNEILGEYTIPEDVLMRIASNLSDLHVDASNLDEKLVMLKQYIFDYMSVLRAERTKPIQEAGFQGGNQTDGLSGFRG